MFKKNFIWFDADAAGGGANGNSGNGDQRQSNEGGANNATLTFEDWQKSLSDEQKGLIESHTKSLKTALESERGSRKDLEKQLRDLAKKSEKDSDAQTQLTKLADELQATDRKAEFYEAAHAAGVRNLKLAYTVATTDEMFDKHGRVNFDEMKKSYPELFASTTPPRGDAGSGTNQKPKTGASMNNFIRAAAGKQ